MKLVCTVLLSFFLFVPEAGGIEFPEFQVKITPYLFPPQQSGFELQLQAAQPMSYNFRMLWQKIAGPKQTALSILVAVYQPGKGFGMAGSGSQKLELQGKEGPTHYIGLYKSFLTYEAGETRIFVSFPSSTLRLLQEEQGFKELQILVEGTRPTLAPTSEDRPMQLVHRLILVEDILNAKESPKNLAPPSSQPTQRKKTPA